MSEIVAESLAWRRVSQHCDEALVVARRTLETPGLPQAATEYERGRIAALTEILALADPAREESPSFPGYAA